MLWEKQIEGNEWVYVDVMKSKKFDMHNCKLAVDVEMMQSEMYNTPAKNDGFSEMYRQHGNDLYLRVGDLEDAIVKYNKGILAAESITENLGMCYANRAACFMELQQYSLCLADIELAKNNNYPKRLWTKLDQRKLKCLQLMDENKDKVPKPVDLSFSPDEKYPCFANGLEMNESQNGDKHIFTKRNLEIGQTIIIEEAFAMMSENPYNYRHCSNCYKAAANLIPCKKCNRVMYCSQRCHDVAYKQFHQIECEINYHSTKWETPRRLALRTVIWAIQTFGSIEALRDAVEQFREQNKIDESDVAKRNYFTFFGSHQGTEKLTYDDEMHFRLYALSMQTIITNVSDLKSMFRTRNNRRFLGHLILHHIYVVHQNAYTAFSLTQHTYKAEAVIGRFSPTSGTVYAGTNRAEMSHIVFSASDAAVGTVYAWGVPLDSMHMRHSCVPNVTRIFVDNKLIYKVIRPIKDGDELFASHMHPVALLLPTRERASALYPLKCECSSCTANLPPFKSTGLPKIGKTLRQLLNLYQGIQHKYEERRMIVDRQQLEKFEKMVIEYLERTDRLHPTEVTLKLQCLLMQIWNNQYVINAAA